MTVNVCDEGYVELGLIKKMMDVAWECCVVCDDCNGDGGVLSEKMARQLHKIYYNKYQYNVHLILFINKQHKQ